MNLIIYTDKNVEERMKEKTQISGLHLFHFTPNIQQLQVFTHGQSGLITLHSPT